MSIASLVLAYLRLCPFKPDMAIRYCAQKHRNTSANGMRNKNTASWMPVAELNIASPADPEFCVPLVAEISVSQFVPV
jgi:hypothetical protein